MRKQVPKWLTSNAKWNEAYAAGLADGAKKERYRIKRGIQKFANEWGYVSTTAVEAAVKIIRDVLASRAKRRRKG